MSLTYRFLESQDLPGIERLWRAETNWGQLGEVQREWFNTNPCEGSMTVVAVDEDGEIAGEMVYMAYRVLVGGREYRALRPIVPIVAKKWRTIKREKPSDHPAIGMYYFGRDVARHRGDGLIFGFPSPRWAGFLRLDSNVKTAKLALFSLPLPLAQPFALPDGFTSRLLEAWDERVDRLWSQTEQLHGCVAIRNRRVLQWKLGLRPYVLTAIERSDELVGLVVSQQQDVQWLICDILCENLGDSLRAALMAACNLANARLVESNVMRLFKKAAIMLTPGIQPVVEELGFKRDEYDFLLMTEALHPDISLEEVAPERWYFSAND